MHIVNIANKIMGFFSLWRVGNKRINGIHRDTRANLKKKKKLRLELKLGIICAIR